MKAKLAAVIITIALLLSAGLTQAADKRELARQYFDLLNFEENIKAAFNYDAMNDIASAGNKFYPNEESKTGLANILKKIQDEFTQPANLNKIKEAMIKIIAEVYSEVELRALVSFYSTKEGQSILKKEPIYAEKSASLLIEVTKPMVEKMTKATIDNMIEKMNKKSKDR